MVALPVAGLDAGGAQGETPRGPTGPPTKPDEDREARIVTERWKHVSDELAGKRRDWWQNTSFFFGEQWVHWDKYRRMQTLANDMSPLGPGRARIVENRIEFNLSSLLARLLRNDLEFDVPPSSSSDDVVAAAMLAEDVCNGSYHDQRWDQVRYDALFAAFMGGTSAVALEWDGSAGTTLEVDPATHRVTGTGDVKLRALNITEFGLEPGVRSEYDARWWVQGFVMPPKVVKEKWGLSWQPAADSSAMMSPTQYRLLEMMGRPRAGDQCLVLVMYERPNKDAPQGKYRVVVNERTVGDTMDAPWPFIDKDCLNVQLFHQKEVQGTWMGATLMNAAVKVQAAYNLNQSLMAETEKMVGNTRIIAAAGSIEEDELTNAVGAYLPYQPDIAGGKPEYMAPPQLPRWMLQRAQDLKASLDDIMHVHETSRGAASFDRASGQALALLAEKDDTPLGLLAHEQSKGWGRIATWVLKEYERRVVETREITVPAQPGAETMGNVRQTRWNGKALRGQTRVYVPLESTMPYSQAARAALANDLWDRKINTDPRLHARMLNLPVRELTAVLDADAARAQRENTRLLQGMPEMPQGFDIHSVHIAEHNRFRKSDSYQYAPQPIKQLIDDHIQMHENMVGEELAAQQLKASMNPALAAAPQAAEPAGSQVPPDYAEQRAGLSPGNPGEMAAAQTLMAGAGGTPPGPQDQGPPTTPQGAPAGSAAIATGGGAP